MEFQLGYARIAILAVPDVNRLVLARRNGALNLFIRVTPIRRIIGNAQNLGAREQLHRHRDEETPFGGRILKVHIRDVIPLADGYILPQYVAISQGNDVSDMDLKDPTAKGSLLIAMPVQLLAGTKVLSVTDNAPDGGNTYKQIQGAVSSCENKAVDIWYCENCNAGVTELKFHLSGRTKGAINAFMEISDMALSSAVDVSGHVTDGKATSAGLEAGPSIKTTAKDFIVARYFPTDPIPTGVTPAPWTYTTSYEYMVDAPDR